MHPTQLRTESLHDPHGLDEDRPRFSWWLTADGHDHRQQAWRIQVCDEDGAVCWDSGRVDDDRQHHVRYAGTPLRPLTRYTWQVQVWDESGQVSAPSAPAHFITGLRDQPWQAQWLHHPVPALPPLPQFRRRFQVDTGLRWARLVISARGLVEPWLDGQRLTEDRFIPGWTDYRQRLHYRLFDLTDRLTPGAHCLGAIVAGGWWKGQIGPWPAGFYAGDNDPLQVLGELHLGYDDGRHEVIASDASWQAGHGAVLEASLLHGEHVDGRRCDPAWCTVDASDAGWLPAAQRERDSVRLLAHPGVPVRVLAELPMRSCTPAGDGSWIYDCGQNLAGIVRLTLDQPAGTIIRLRHGEMVEPDGSLYVDNLRSAKATDCYICRGEPGEVFEPRFTFHGFRYVEITGLREPLPLCALRVLALGSDTPEAGRFTCSEPMIERLQSNIRWTMRANFLEVPTDCPQRDERLGWTGDAQVFAATAIGNADCEAFFRKWLADIDDARGDDGGIPDFIPARVRGSGADAAWGDVATVLPHVLALHYGDPDLLAAAWPLMRGWCDYCAQYVEADGTRRRNFCYGDWLAPDNDAPPTGKALMDRSGKTPKALIQTAYYIHSCRLAARAGEAAGDQTAAAALRQRAAAARAAFHRTFVHADGRIGEDTQTGYVLALAFDLLDPAQRPVAAAHLAADIHRRGDHLATGFVGITDLLPMLADHGHLDLAYALLHTQDYPGWGYSIAQGATTIWERWNGWVAGQRPDDPMNSYSHYAYGSVGSFFYRWICGLAPLEPGYRLARIAPHPDGGWRHAGYRYDSIAGPWEVAWQAAEGGWAYRITIPPNCRARCRLPLGSASSLIWDGPAPEGQREGAYLLVELGSGRYTARPS